MRVAYVTFEDREVDTEIPVVLGAWAAEGLDGEALRWDDAEADWSAFDAAVIRSTWDYVPRRAEFTAWARRTSQVTRLFNPAGVIERNTDKTYLRDLAAAGIPIVPTEWFGPGDEPVLANDWAETVVKPNVSVGAQDTSRHDSREGATAAIRAIQESGRTAMVQPYLDMVEAEGETSLLFFGGRYSHAVRRPAMLARDGSGALATGDPREAAADQLELARAVLAEIGEPLLYARVDLVRSASGDPLLIELELTEPHLFLAAHEKAPARFAGALRDLLA
ncbi:ATP-grasp domain-containing protein [Bailinhaonella thermotolerans]|nr:hypothetical protein [Bailinhaonella thermotolerans]